MNFSLVAYRLYGRGRRLLRRALKLIKYTHIISPFSNAIASFSLCFKCKVRTLVTDIAREQNHTNTVVFQFFKRGSEMADI